MALAALFAALLFACAKPSQKAAMPLAAGSGDATESPSHAIATDSSSAQAEAGPPGEGGTDTSADVRMRGCRSDGDCVAVDRVGCCHNGWKEAVAASAKEAYARSFTCHEEHPMCPMYIVRDSRVALCARSSAEQTRGLCTMVRP